MRHFLLILLSTCLLSGCAGLLQDLQDMNANLHSLNSALRINGSSTPGVHVVNATVGDTCNQAAYEEGFKRKYISDWNYLVGVRENLYRLTVEQHPNDPAAQHNFALYRGRKLEPMKYGPSVHGLSSDDPCIRLSYTQGQLAGGQAVDRDFEALEGQEI